MPSGGGNTTTQSTNSEPWAAAQPYLKDAMGEAQNLYNTGTGFSPYPNSTVVPFSSQTQSALNNIQGLAESGNPLGQAAQSATLGVLNNGGLSSLGQQAANGLSGIGGPNAIQSNLSNYASGANVNGGGPEFQQALNYQAGQLTNDIDRSFSNAGRYGSMAHGGEIASQVGQMRNQATAQEMARQQGQQIQAAGMLSGEQQQGLANQLNAYGQMGQLGQGANSQLGQFVGLSPSVYAQQYAPQQQMMNVGAQYEDLAGRTLQDQITRFQQGQQQPWNLLGAYQGALNGMGQMGGSSTQSVQQPRNWGAPLGGALGGAQLGSMFGPIGTGIGAVGGGLLGLMGM